MYSKDDEYNIAFKQAFDIFYRDLCNFATRKIKDHDLASMIVTDVFMKALSKKISVAKQELIGRLLFRMVNNACIDHLRHQRVEKKLFRRFALYAHSGTNHVSPFEKDIPEGKEIMDKSHLREEIEQLPEKCREVVKKHYFDNISLKNLARQRGISESGMRNLMAYARRLLRHKLERRNK